MIDAIRSIAAFAHGALPAWWWWFTAAAAVASLAESVVSPRRRLSAAIGGVPLLVASAVAMNGTSEQFGYFAVVWAYALLTLVGGIFATVGVTEVSKAPLRRRRRAARKHAPLSA